MRIIAGDHSVDLSTSHSRRFIAKRTNIYATVTQNKTKALSFKNGKVAVKKGAAKGTYTMKLVAKVKGTANYGAASTKTVTVKVTVR